jgi:hypothetical protein
MDVHMLGCTEVCIDAGFEVAPGDDRDVEVAYAHSWGSEGLIFSDGSRVSIAEAQRYGKKGRVGRSNLKVDSAGRFRVTNWDIGYHSSNYDVLLRKRA